MKKKISSKNPVLNGIPIISLTTRKIAGKEVKAVVLRTSTLTRLSRAIKMFDALEQEVGDVKTMLDDAKNIIQVLEMRLSESLNKCSGLQESNNILNRREESRRGLNIPDGTKSTLDISQEKQPANYSPLIQGGLAGLGKK